MSPQRDVVVTGLGVVSPLGNDLVSFWDGLLAGSVPVQPLDYPGTAIHGVRSYLVNGAPGSMEPGRGRATGFALVAAGAALEDAGLASRDAALLAEVGVCLGTGNGDSGLQEAERDGRRACVEQEWFPYGSVPELAAVLGVHGPSLTVSTACAAGAYAVSLGMEAVADGRADAMLVGGTEAVSRPAMGAFLRLGASDPLHCRPFDVNRRGTVYGEGSAFMVLESAMSAAARGRRAYARVLGAGWSCDGFHVTAPDPSSEHAARAARDALTRGGVPPESVVGVVSHGTGTPANDSVESRTTAHVLGERAPNVPVAAIKSALGHSGGASGAFSCVTAALAVRYGVVPPVGTLAALDPECQLRLARDVPEDVPPGTWLINAYAFGGNNISLVVGPPPVLPGLQP